MREIGYESMLIRVGSDRPGSGGTNACALLYADASLHGRYQAMHVVVHMLHPSQQA